MSGLVAAVHGAQNLGEHCFQYSLLVRTYCKSLFSSHLNIVSSVRGYYIWNSVSPWMTWDTFHVWFIRCDLWIGLTSVMSPDHTKINLNYSRNLTVRIQCPLIANQFNIMAVSKTCRERLPRMLVEREKWGMQMTSGVTLGWCLWRMRTIPVCSCLTNPSRPFQQQWRTECAWNTSVLETLVAQAQNLCAQSQSELWHMGRKGRVWTFFWVYCSWFGASSQTTEHYDFP